MNEDAYFPLRSNLGYFQSKANQPTLINRIKQSILLYENLIFDFGVYGLMCNENGAFDFIDHEPENYPEVAEEEITNVMLMAEFPDENLPIIEPGTGKFYRSSFYPIIQDLDLLQEDFIKFISYSFTNEGEAFLKNSMEQTKSLKDLIDLPPICRDKVFENFHKSIMVSNSIGTPLMIDGLNTPIIGKLADISIQQDNRLEVLDAMLNTAENHINDCMIPDFSNYETDSLLDLRKDKSFQRLREKILEINNAIIKFDESELEKIVMGEVVKETTSELQELAPTRPKLIFHITTGLLGCLPGISEIISLGKVTYDAINGSKELHEYENSWLAFILQYEG